MSSETRVCEERLRMGLTHEQVGRSIGTSARVVRQYEAGRPIPERHLLAMRRLFGCDLDWLLCLSDQRRDVGRRRARRSDQRDVQVHQLI